MPDKLSYSVKEAHAATGIKPRTLQHLHQTGKLPGSRIIGRSIIIPAATLHGILDGTIDTKQDSTDGKRLQEA